MEPRLSFVAGQPVVVGLAWEIGDTPSAAQKVRVGSAGQGFVCFSGSIAEARSAALIGNAPLAALVATLLAGERDISAAIMPLDDGGFWGAQFKDGSVLIDSEELFDDAQSSIEWAAQAKRSNAVAQIYLPNDFIDTARVVDTGLDPQTLPDLSTLSDEDLAAAPVFKPFYVLTPKRAFTVGSTAAVVALVGWGLSSLVNMRNDRSNAAEVSAPVVMEHFASDASVFARACTAALSEEWPGVPGWEVASIGCALSNSTRPIGDMQSSVVWKEFQRGSRYAAIVGSEVTSARMAEYMLRDWPHLKQVTEGRIIVAHGLETEWVPYIAPSETTIAFETQIENAFISVLEQSSRPQSISVAQGQGQPVANAVQTRSVDLNTSMELAFSLAQALDGIEISAIDYEDGVSTLQLSPTTSRFSRPANTALASEISIPIASAPSRNQEVNP